MRSLRHVAAVFPPRRPGPARATVGVEGRVMTVDLQPHAGAEEPPGGAPAAGSQLFPPRDRQLLDGCIQGDPAAWDAFVDRFCDLLGFVIDRTAAQRRCSLAPAARDDLLADVLLELIHHDAAVLRGFTGRSTLATYLTVVARRVVVRGLRNVAARAPESPRGSAGHDGGRHGSEAPEATLVRLHDVEGRSYGEISRLTGMPLASIGPALKRARQARGQSPG